MFLLLLKVVVLNVEMLKIVVNCYRVETRENKTEENKKVSLLSSSSKLGKGGGENKV